MRYALKFAYDGSQFEGYARQPDFYTTEGHIIWAMKKQKIIESVEESKFASSSRTDKGVSAAGNVLAITTDFRKDAILKALNPIMEGIVFYAIAEVPEGYNPRHARQRTYRYILQKNQCPEIDKLKATSELFLEEQDFKYFSKTDDRHEITRLKLDSIELIEEGQYIIVEIKAHRFLWQLVRRLVSFMLAVANGEVSEEKVKEMLNGTVQILASPKPMPPENLILMDVKFKFDFEELAGEGFSFNKLQNKAILRAGVMGQIVERV
ncbi:MAG: tRNA pseudouridine(38-40) synthase TruA [Thermoplasmata archaeon]|nr:tRNA pseudouridine(38-40) synthase TruA [Thermoplasmata archaeon]